MRLHRRLFLVFVLLVLISCGSAEYPDNVADSADNIAEPTSSVATVPLVSTCHVHLSPLVTPVKADGNDGNVADSSDEANDVTFELAPAAA